MEIRREREDKKLTLAPAGRLDTVTAPELEEVLKEELPETEQLVMDLSELVYLSSAGLRLLLSAHKNMMEKGGMVVTGVNETIMDIFDITGFTDLLTIE